MAYTTINKSTDYFNTKLWTGTGSSNALTGVGFQPDWTWIKNRTDAQSHVLQDAVRGVGNTIISNNTDAQSAEGAGDLTAFGSDGFTVGTNGRVNGSGKSIVAWNWKAGTGQGSSNTAGSINTTYTSVNTAAGFSISSYTGTGSSATIGHSLGVAPEFIITKSLSLTQDWNVQATALGYSKYLILNGTSAQANTSGALISSVSSSTVTVDGNSQVNGSGATYVMYCFASKTGYSKIGSYTGNLNADGTFVYTGFKPAFVIIKRTDGGTNDWILYDSKRNINGIENALEPNNNNSESTVIGKTNYNIDLLSNGFKPRSDSDQINNGSYIYMAFGQSLVGTNNVPCTAR